MIGSSSAKAATPAYGSNSTMICSGPYAVEEIASGESAPNATGLDNLSDSSCSLVSGLPRNIRLQMSANDDGIRCPSSLPANIVTRHFLGLLDDFACRADCRRHLRNTSPGRVTCAMRDLMS